jgi:hypothetical protein
MIYRYYLPEHGQSADDSYTVDVEWGDADPELIADDAAQDYFNEHDGWESSWPLTIVVVLQDGTERKFSVDMESVPRFFARATE